MISRTYTKCDEAHRQTSEGRHRAARADALLAVAAANPAPHIPQRLSEHTPSRPIHRDGFLRASVGLRTGTIAVRPPANRAAAATATAPHKPIARVHATAQPRSQRPPLRSYAIPVT